MGFLRGPDSLAEGSFHSRRRCVGSQGPVCGAPGPGRELAGEWGARPARAGALGAGREDAGRGARGASGARDHRVASLPTTTATTTATSAPQPHRGPGSLTLQLLLSTAAMFTNACPQIAAEARGAKKGARRSCPPGCGRARGRGGALGGNARGAHARLCAACLCACSVRPSAPG